MVAYASELSNKFGITNFDVRVTRQRRMPSAFKSSHVLSTTGQNRSCDTDELTAQLHQVLGQISSEIRHRFADDQIGIMSTAACCLPFAENFVCSQTILKFANLFSLQVKEAELDVFKAFVLRQNTSEMKSLNDVLGVIDRDIFPFVYSVYLILVTIPQTSCTVERLFSSVKRIKTRIRSRMTTSRLNSLGLLSFEKDLTCSLNYDDILLAFRTMKARRLFF